MVIGHLGADVTLRYTPSGQPVADMRVATNRSWKDKNDAVKTATEWHRVVVWGKQAESCAKYLSKGRQVLVEGRLQTRTWEDKDGIKRWTTEIVAQQVQFLSGRPSAQSSEDPPLEEETKIVEIGVDDFPV